MQEEIAAKHNDRPDTIHLKQFVTTQDDVRTNIITGGGGRND